MPANVVIARGVGEREPIFSERYGRNVRRVILVTLAVAATACTADSGVPAEPPRSSAEVASAAALEVRADGCGPRQGFGTASLISDHLAVTAAHVVAGASSVGVVDQQGAEYAASVVYFDPDLDVAVLRVPDQIAVPAIVSNTGVEPGSNAILTVFRGSEEDRGPTNLDVEVIRRANVATTDIYLDADVVRPGFEINGAIDPGDSGALVVINGGGVGVLWARSTANEGRAWVVNIPDPLRAAELDTTLIDPVETGECIR
jgi:S1-C subfamily serine protease